MGLLTNEQGAYLWTGGDSGLDATSINNYGEIVTSGPTNITGGISFSTFNNGPSGTIINGGILSTAPDGMFTNAGIVTLLAQPCPPCSDTGMFEGGTYIQTARLTVDDYYMQTTALDLEGGIFEFGSSQPLKTESLTLGPESILYTTGTYAPGSILTVAEYTSLAGTFGSIDGIPFPGSTWDVMYGSDSLTLTATPEPSGLTLLALAVLVAAGFGLRRRITTAS